MATSSGISGRSAQRADSARLLRVFICARFANNQNFLLTLSRFGIKSIDLNSSSILSPRSSLIVVDVPSTLFLKQWDIILHIGKGSDGQATITHLDGSTQNVASLPVTFIPLKMSSESGLPVSPGAEYWVIYANTPGYETLNRLKPRLSIPSWLGQKVSSRSSSSTSLSDCINVSAPMNDFLLTGRSSVRPPKFAPLSADDHRYTANGDGSHSPSPLSSPPSGNVAFARNNANLACPSNADGDLVKSQMMESFKDAGELSLSRDADLNSEVQAPRMSKRTRRKNRRAKGTSSDASASSAKESTTRIGHEEGMLEAVKSTPPSVSRLEDAPIHHSSSSSLFFPNPLPSSSLLCETSAKGGESSIISDSSPPENAIVPVDADPILLLSSTVVDENTMVRVLNSCGDRTYQGRDVITFKDRVPVACSFGPFFLRWAKCGWDVHKRFEYVLDGTPVDVLNDSTRTQGESSSAENSRWIRSRLHESSYEISDIGGLEQTFRRCLVMGLKSDGAVKFGIFHHPDSVG